MDNEQVDDREEEEDNESTHHNKNSYKDRQRNHDTKERQHDNNDDGDLSIFPIALKHSSWRAQIRMALITLALIWKSTAVLTTSSDVSRISEGRAAWLCRGRATFSAQPGRGDYAYIQSHLYKGEFWSYSEGGVDVGDAGDKAERSRGEISFSTLGDQIKQRVRESVTGGGQENLASVVVAFFRLSQD